ncbi:hypothetical protein [Arthrobacter sp. EpRS71]|uniref:hypothetical protein n=1 Tax=Arthrobacter sp. EpRS71 TaxID=1743141 RepID=UPI00074821DB|nr:hypothetical protein [Arthrobacter sp. EpRS71]KUM36089.1 hypothetical protein AR689_19220 [Arthrobacter sp. EpRS71]
MSSLITTPAVHGRRSARAASTAVVTVPALFDVEAGGISNAIRALREPIVMNTLMDGAPAIQVIGMLAPIWNKNPARTTPGAAVETRDEASA